MPISGVIPELPFGANTIGAVYNALSNQAIERKKQELLNEVYGENLKQSRELFPSKKTAAELENQKLAMENELFLPTKKAALDLQKLKIKYPLLFATGAAGQIGAAQYANENLGFGNQSENPNQNIGSLVADNSLNTSPVSSNQNSNPGQQILNALLQANQAKESRRKYDEARTKGYQFSQLPVDYKSEVLAQAAGLGYSPEEASSLLLSGKTIQDLAREKGFPDLNKLPSPIFALTAPGRTQLQRRQQALAELNAVSSDMRDAISYYQPRIKGNSPRQIVDALKGTNKDKQAKFLAAKALQPELAAIRLRMANGNVGIEAIREMVNASLGKIDVPESLVGSDVYSKAQDYIDKWINKMAEAANKQATQIKAQSGTSIAAEDDPLGIL